MDNLTHTLTGLLLSRTGFGSRCPRAGLLLMIAANAPDIDLVMAAGGSEVYLNHHRGLTHGVAMIPILALLPTLIVGFARRRSFPWIRAWLLASLGVASHLAMDSTNIYGVRLLAPFSWRWFALDITGVIDLWIWLMLAIAVFWPLLARLVSVEIGARPGSGRGIAIVALCSLVAYDGARFLLHRRAVAVLDARIYDGMIPRRVAAFPGPANPFRWSGLIETASFYRKHRVDLLAEFDPGGGAKFIKPAPGPEMEAARGTQAFQAFLRFSRFPLWRVTPIADRRTEVQAFDLRFGVPNQERFVATAIVDEQLRVRHAWFQFEKPGPPPPRD